MLFNDWWFSEFEIVFFMVACCFLLLSRVLLLFSDLSLRKLFLFELDLFCWSWLVPDAPRDAVFLC